MPPYSGAPQNPTPYFRRYPLKYGGSYCRRPRERFYIRRFDSLHHYPIWNTKQRGTLDWLYIKPLSGYEVSPIWSQSQSNWSRPPVQYQISFFKICQALRQFGPHTLQLNGIPHGITNQFIEERLRRFFSKFGPIVRCHSVPHPRDAFQSSGIAFITFDSRVAALRASRSHLKFPRSFGNRVIQLRNLENDVTQNGDWYSFELHVCDQLRSIARDLYALLASHPSGIPLQKLSKLLTERGFKGSAIHSAWLSVHRVFGSWQQFIDSPPMRKLFILSHEWRGRRRLPRFSPPTQRAEHVQNILAGMIHRGEWVMTWGDHLGLQKTIDARGGHHVTTDQESVFNRKPSEQISIGEAIQRGEIPKGNSFETALVNAALRLQPTNSNKVSMEAYQPEEKEFIELALRRLQMIRIVVSRRTLSPEIVEDFLRNVHDHAIRVTEDRRTHCWSEAKSELPR